MKHIRKFEGFRIRKHREEIIKESVLQVNDLYKVKTMIDIPQSLINAYVKKVKDTTGKNLRQFFGDVDIAEEIVKYIAFNNTDVEKIPGNALMGGSQGQVQTEVEAQLEAQPQAQTEAQPQAQPEAQPEAQPQAQVQVQTEVESQPEAQPQAQPQAQEEDFEEPKEEEKAEGEEEKAEGEEEKAEGEEELPL